MLSTSSREKEESGALESLWSRTKTKLLKTLRHNYNNLVMATQSYCDLQGEEQDDAQKIKEGLVQIKQRSLEAKKIFEQMMDLMEEGVSKTREGLIGIDEKRPKAFAEQARLVLPRYAAIEIKMEQEMMHQICMDEEIRIILLSTICLVGDEVTEPCALELDGKITDMGHEVVITTNLSQNDNIEMRYGLQKSSYGDQQSMRHHVNQIKKVCKAMGVGFQLRFEEMVMNISLNIKKKQEVEVASSV